jgi:hypothetical protein
VTFVPPTLAAPTPVALRSLPAYSGNCGPLLTRKDFLDLDSPSMAWSPALGKTVAVWLEERPATSSTVTARSVLFSVLSRTQAAATPREVWGVGPNPARLTPSTEISQPPRVAVGATTVLFAWSNDAFQPLNGRRIRWVLYDSALTSVVAGPGDYTFPFAVAAPTPMVDAVSFDGVAYQLLVNPHVDPSGTQDGLVRLLTVSETGALLSERRLMTTTPTAAAGGGTYSAAAAVAMTPVTFDGGAGYAIAGSRDSFLKFGTFPVNPDGGISVVEVDLGTAATSRTDFAIAPLDNGRVGVVWSDGDLKKTVLRCGP